MRNAYLVCPVADTREGSKRGSRPASEMTYIMSGGTLNSTHSLTPGGNFGWAALWLSIHGLHS